MFLNDQNRSPDLPARISSFQRNSLESQFEKLVKEHEPKALRVLHRKYRGLREHFDDFLAEARIHVWQKWMEKRGEIHDFARYFIRSVMNTVIDFLRAAPKEESMEVLQVDPQWDGRILEAVSSLDSPLVKALMEMPKLERSLFLQRMNGLTIKQIASRTHDNSYIAIRNRYYRGQRTLFQKMTEHGFGRDFRYDNISICMN